MDRIIRNLVSRMERETNLTPGVRNQINKKLTQLGLGGQVKFDKPGSALAKAVEVLQQYRIELAETVTFYERDRERFTISLARSTEDPFSPTPIKSVLVLISTRMDSGRYEVIGYIP